MRTTHISAHNRYINRQRDILSKAFEIRDARDAATRKQTPFQKKIHSLSDKDLIKLGNVLKFESQIYSNKTIITRYGDTLAELAKRGLLK
jgi:hypothetical protein